MAPSGNNEGTEMIKGCAVF